MKVFLPHVEVGITRRCMNLCAACNHLTPLEEAPFEMPAEVLREDLRRLGEVAEIGRLGMLGGEPCLHPDIDRMLLLARAVNITRNVVLITTGQLLERMTERFWKTVPAIQLHRYPGKLSDERFKWIVERCTSEGITLQVVRVQKFFPCLRKPSATETAEEAALRYKRCLMARLCLLLDYGYLYGCPQSAVIPRLFMREHPGTVDGLPLDGITPDKLLAFMTNTLPLKSCARCSVNESTFDWRETTREKWVEDSTHAV